MDTYHQIALELEHAKKEYYKSKTCSVPFSGDSNVYYLKDKIEYLENALEKEKYKYEKEESMSDYYGVDPNMKSWDEKKEYLYNP